MPFSRVAPIAIQLVLHFCGRTEWLRFASCSRGTFAAASTLFAARFLPPIPLHWSSLHSRIWRECEDARVAAAASSLPSLVARFFFARSTALDSVCSSTNLSNYDRQRSLLRFWPVELAWAHQRDTALFQRCVQDLLQLPQLPVSCVLREHWFDEEQRSYLREVHGLTKDDPKRRHLFCRLMDRSGQLGMVGTLNACMLWWSPQKASVLPLAAVADVLYTRWFEMDYLASAGVLCRVRTLTLPNAVMERKPSELCALFAGTPAVHTLKLTGNPSPAASLNHPVLRLLEVLPLLTSLTISHAWVHSASLAEPVATCVPAWMMRLRALHLQEARYDPPSPVALCPVLTSPQLSGLEHLILAVGTEVSLCDSSCSWSRCFDNLARLRSLFLIKSSKLADILEGLLTNPRAHLTHIRIVYHGERAPMFPMPDMHAHAAAMALRFPICRPQLCTLLNRRHPIALARLEVQPETKALDRRYVDAYMEHRFVTPEQRKELRAVQLCAPDRVHILAPEHPHGPPCHACPATEMEPAEQCARCGQFTEE